MNRTDSCFLIEAALSACRADYAQAMARAWLSAWPGDLGMRFYLARTSLMEQPSQTGYPLNLLDSVVEVDFENAAAHRLIGDLRAPEREQEYATAWAINGQPLPPDTRPPPWLAAARRAVIALSAGQFDTARESAEIALGDGSAPPLVELIMLNAIWRGGKLDLAWPLAEGLHEQYPKCVAILLCLTEAYFRFGQPHRAVELLHTASALDPAGEVVSRYWGRSHSYINLWPQQTSIPLPGPIPAEVITLLGLNRIASGSSDLSRSSRSPQRATEVATTKATGAQPATNTRVAATGRGRKQGRRTHAKNESNRRSTTSEELRDIQEQLNTVASKVNTARSHRQPAHVILYSTKLMRAKFGPEAGTEIISHVEHLASVVEKHRRLPVIVLAPDDVNRLALFNLSPVEASNPWAIKMMLHDLDRQLARKGQAIGSLLIIGGDDLLPFHRLPNPTDDIDGDLPSDNPYATTDDNYFIPEWPVGRLPSPCGGDPDPLRRLLQATIAAHQHAPAGESWWRRFANTWARFGAAARREPSSGYAASVWKEASFEVFAPVGAAEAMRTSPPLNANSAPSAKDLRFAYFNLHGVEDSPEWFGQRDSDDQADTLYPVAYTPAAINKNGAAAPRVIYSEACYGANIIGKQETDAALSLQFLHDGAGAFVGSTKIAYGSIGMPLIGADLLGRYFWEGVVGGLAVGEALRRAKISLAQSMHKQQSFLDGEDQKTLITFLLYGDPLLPGTTRPAGRTHLAKSFASSASARPVAMEYEAAEDQSRPETVAEIKSLLARYLPGAQSAEVHVGRPLVAAGAKGTASHTHRVYTLAKTMRANSRELPAFARVTVDRAGKVIKVAVSR